MKPKKLSQKDKLIYFLIDNNDFGCLLAAYQNFIAWQNNFLQPIIENGIFSGILNYYIKNMKSKIPIQEANPNQILYIEECFKNSIYEDFDELIYSFSKRDIFDKNGMTNYSNYNSFKFDISSLEEELAKLLLPEKCLFEGEKNLNLITYWGEGFIGRKCDIINKFYLKYNSNNYIIFNKI